MLKFVAASFLRLLPPRSLASGKIAAASAPAFGAIRHRPLSHFARLVLLLLLMFVTTPCTESPRFLTEDNNQAISVHTRPLHAANIHYGDARAHARTSTTPPSNPPGPFSGAWLVLLLVHHIIEL
jgi:hypothetical protein